MIFGTRPKLQKHLSLRVENENAESAMQLGRPPMRRDFLNRPNRAIVFIDENDLLVHRR
jgi:hypothetical protein